MQHKNPYQFMMVASIFLMAIAVMWLGAATPVSAQCGSQASSCKNCHEVQGKDPVNTDGTDWHESHAFGDFCYICHGGNNQATDETEAHTGMVSPLSDIQASCMQCHPSDLEKRAQVYATALGVEIGGGDDTSSTGNPSNSDDQSTDNSSTSDDQSTGNSSTSGDQSAGSTEAASSIPAGSELVVDDANLVDYNQRYDEIVLGEKPVNWGNLILIGLIGLLIVGGGGFVLYHEGWLSITTTPIEPVPNGFQKEVVDLLPDLQHLNKKGRQGLRTILQSPDCADELLDALGHYTHKGA
jgi:hypothetical protein